MIKCTECNLIFKNERSLRSHTWRSHTLAGIAHKPGIGKSQVPWNKGLTKETDERVSKHSLQVSETMKDRPGVKHTNQAIKNISISMKKAHAKGRAHNIGESRWNNEPSYPETFFMNVIENEFVDQNYIREAPFHKFSLDFLWPHKKKVIEIDGEQHERFEEQIRRDNEKDSLLESEGYVILRIRWKDMFNETKYWISIAKDFVDT